MTKLKGWDIIMKILIWIICSVVFSFIQTAIKDFGIVLGAIPTMFLYGIFYVIVDMLCNSWDIKKYKKKYPNDIFEEMFSIIELHKNDFLNRKQYTVQEDGTEIFDLVKRKISHLSTKKVKK